MAVDTTAIAIASSVIEFLTAIVTLLRLAFRLRIRRFWWEDVWAAVAMVGAIAFVVALLIYFQAQNLQTVNVADWICSYAFTSVVWSVRMSLLYSIVRITSPSTCLRKFMHAIGALFVVVWALLITLKTWWCEDSSKFQLGRPICIIPYSMAIFEVTADFVGDATLVILSLKLLWRIKLPRRQRRMILLTFSSNTIMSMSSLLRAVAQIINDESLELIFANLEFISSLIVCNLLVVVTYIYRVCMSSSESENSSEDDDFTTPVSGITVSGTTQYLTTVDLDALDSTTTGPPMTRHISFLTSPISSAAS